MKYNLIPKKVQETVIKNEKYQKQAVYTVDNNGLNPVDNSVNDGFV